MWEVWEAMQRSLMCSYSISPLSPHPPHTSHTSPTPPTPHTQKASYIRALRLTSVPFGTRGENLKQVFPLVPNSPCPQVLFPIPHSPCPMPNAQIRAILSLPAKIVAIVTEVIWQSES
ncbi:hypothetical protein H6G91_08685 [Nostoc muscorum FACHB-395]|nr:hypothetical protein [Desmonostoc muscorum FACHB-395]